VKRGAWYLRRMWPEAILRALSTVDQTAASMSRLRLSFALLLMGLGAGPLQAQSLAPAAPSTRAFQAGIEEAARLTADQPHFKRLSPRQRQAHVEFVFGNILFVAAHELGHALVSEMKLPILGREEDAADVFAIVTALQIGDHLSHRVLEQATKGWFLAARRDKREGYALGYYERHGLNEQRAYQIVCLMVGSDPVKFRTLADETKLPQDRRRTCVWDYERGAPGTACWRATAAPRASHERTSTSATRKARVRLRSPSGFFAPLGSWKPSPSTSLSAMSGPLASSSRCEAVAMPMPAGPFSCASCTSVTSWCANSPSSTATTDPTAPSRGGVSKGMATWPKASSAIPREDYASPMKVGLYRKWEGSPARSKR
jgi:hypothetical protein